MALSKIDVANMLTGATPVANGGTALTSGFVNGSDPRPLSKPIIINGDCSVAQRGTANTDESSSGVYRVDRMNVGLSSIGEFRLSQESLSSGAAYNAGFKKAFRIDCTTADGSPSSSDNIFMQYKLEGNSVQVFKKGTSNAEKYTLAFWVKSNKTGTAQVNLVDGDNSRQVGATYTISSANTWEHKVLNYPADTTGAFDDDNNKSLEIEWALDAGSDFTSGAVPSAWESSSNADRSVNDLALGDNTANDWAITGIQLEVGEFSSTTLPPFQFEDFNDNLRRCLRYCYQISGDGSNATDLTQITGTGGAGFGSFRFPVQMRASPTQSDSGDDTFTMYGPNTGDPSSLRGDRTNPNSCGIVTDTSITSGNSVNIRVDTGTSNFIRFDAELYMKINSVKLLKLVGFFSSYVLTLDDDEVLYVPNDPDNRHYQGIQEWVAEGNTIEE